MESLNFKTNIKQYAINGDESKVISVCTTDFAILDRIKRSLKSIDEISKNYENRTTDDSDEVNELFVSADRDIRGQINSIFNSDVCTMAFGNVNCLSLCDDGSYLFENFINAIIPIIHKDVTDAQAKQSKHVEKYVTQAKRFSK